MIYFVSRHKGAQEWIRLQGYPIDAVHEHLDPAILQEGDIVIGSLPVHLAADVCRRKCRYVHLSMDMTRMQRGVELTPAEMKSMNARLEEFVVLPAEAGARD